ncbi:hypothetical protein O3P69_005215 [Scylla paramamosain]|uniref:Uncharacterized protein n=1 Tax=Scylla paramamosain TaxID=85552 RepID=A0AAW0U789_SCYPA
MARVSDLDETIEYVAKLDTKWGGVDVPESGRSRGEDMVVDGEAWGCPRVKLRKCDAAAVRCVRRAALGRTRRQSPPGGQPNSVRRTRYHLVFVKYIAVVVEGALDHLAVEGHLGSRS